MKNLSIIAISVVFSTTVLVAELSNNPTQNTFYNEQPRWNASLDFKEIEDELTYAPVKHITPMATFLMVQGKQVEFDNEVYLVELSSGLKAVFKPSSCYYAEVAAYRASYFLGDKLVPPTVLREIDGSLGSLQFFVDTDVDLRKDLSLFESVSEEQKILMELFYFVFGQWDRGIDNRLIQHTEDQINLALIDNEGIENHVQVRWNEPMFVRIGYDDNYTSLWDEPFPFDNPCKERNIKLERAKELFGTFLPSCRLNRLWARKKGTLVYVIWRQGLWMQYYEHESSSTLLTSPQAKKLAQRYKNLTQDHLRQFWHEALLTEEARRYEELIRLTLERKKILGTRY